MGTIFQDTPGFAMQLYCRAPSRGRSGAWTATPLVVARMGGVESEALYHDMPVQRSMQTIECLLLRVPDPATYAKRFGLCSCTRVQGLRRVVGAMPVLRVAFAGSLRLCLEPAEVV